MRCTLLLLTLPLIFSFAQDNLPEYGDISDLKNLQRVYLTADSTDARQMILKELKKHPSLVVVNRPEEAEFFIEYKVLRSERVKVGIFTGTAEATAEMTAYTLKDSRRRIAWSKTEDNDGLSRPNEINLTRNFIKALKTAQK